MRVFVLDKNRKPLMPCHPARARKLLSKGKAAVFRMNPFTIILKDRTLEESTVQPIELRIDPGSKTTGMSLVGLLNNTFIVLWIAHLHHRGEQVKERLEKRKMYRRNRRNRKTRYRKCKCKKLKSKTDTSGKDLSSNKKGWLPPSLMSRINNIYNWVIKLQRFVPFEFIAVEHVNFDTSSITAGVKLYGTQYQHGTLHGYKVKQYLLELHNYKCDYCNASNVPLEVEHIIPKSRGGTNNISNLTISCVPCNQRKGSKTASEFGFPRVQKNTILNQDIAAVNSTKNKLVELLQSTGLNVSKYDSTLTKYNRKIMNYTKDHHVDASCVGLNPGKYTSTNTSILNIKAIGRGSRHYQANDEFGFPRKTEKGELVRSIDKKSRVYKGYRTGDIVHVTIPNSSEYKGNYYFVRITISSKGQFSFKYTRGKTIYFSYNTSKIIPVHKNDGYNYSYS